MGPIELWTKWTCEPLELNLVSTIAIAKQRWFRKFDTTSPQPREIPLDGEEQALDQRPLPMLVYNAESTQTNLPDGDVWWTFGLEAFGTLDTVTNDLRAATSVLATRWPPA